MNDMIREAALGVVENAYRDRDLYTVPVWALDALRAALGLEAPDWSESVFEGE